MKLKEYEMIFAGLADETRLRILSLLTEGELCVCDIMRVLKEPQSKISRHLAYLRKVGLVEVKRKGLWMYYRLAGERQPLLKAVYESLKTSRGDLDELKKDLGEYRKSKGCLVACCP